MAGSGVGSLVLASEMTMRVEVNFSAIKESSWLQLAARFVAGGIATAVIGLIARKYGPSIGGLFLAFPAIFPASATLIDKHERERKEQKGLSGRIRARQAAAVDAAGAAMGSTGLLIFALLISHYIARHSPLLVIVAAAAIWLAVSLLVWRIRKAL
jgi:Protein of unknown function (DUF3147)